jgi:polyisoprenoid-binding protein YceI
VAAYSIVAGASEVLVFAKSTVHAINGTAVEVDGAVDARMDGGVPRSLDGRIEVPIKSLRSGNALYDAELQRRVDARRFPSIVGQVRKAVPLGEDGLFRVEGDVTFHGVTRAVEGKVHVREDGDRLTLEGEHVFDIRDFGVKPPKILVLRVEPTVRVRIRLVADPSVGGVGA